MVHLNDTAIERIAFIRNYLPRQCGLATFTADLCEAIANQLKGTACIALPVNDIEAGYNYLRVFASSISYFGKLEPTECRL